MTDRGVLERDRADPLAAGAHHVLRPIGDVHVSVRVDRGDVASREPAPRPTPRSTPPRRENSPMRSRGRARTARRRSCRRGAAARPGSSTILNSTPQMACPCFCLSRRCSEGLSAAIAGFSCTPRPPDSSRSCPSRAALRRRTPPRTPRSWRAVARHRRSRPARTRSVGAGLTHMVEQAEPDRRHARRRRSRSRSICWYRLAPSRRAGHHHARADQRAGIGQAPGVDVEHGHDRQHVSRLLSPMTSGMTIVSACSTVERW